MKPKKKKNVKRKAIKKAVKKSGFKKARNINPKNNGKKKSKKKLVTKTKNIIRKRKSNTKNKIDNGRHINKRGGLINKKTVRKRAKSKQAIPRKKLLSVKPSKNILTILTPQRSFEKKANSVKKITNSKLNLLVNANKIVKGKLKKTGEQISGVKEGISKEPKAIITIFKIKKRNMKGYSYKSIVSDPDFVVNAESVKKLVANQINEYNSDMQEVITQISGEAITPYPIVSVSIRFIY